MGAREPDSATSDAEAEMFDGGVRAVPGNKPADEGELVAESCEDALVAGARSIADSDKLMGELQTERDYLQSEAERVRWANDRYAHLAQTASASVRIIAENLGKWRNVENVSPGRTATPGVQAPTLSPIDGQE